MSDTSSLKKCPKCGEPIPGEAPHGLCPKCLLAQASIPTESGNNPGAKLVPPSQPEIAAAFPQFEILGLIGQGGMGFVFKARQPKLERLVALKILPQSFSADPAFAERFTREGRVLARLDHPNIVTIHDFGQANGFFYLLMEYVDGVNLRQAMRAGRFTPNQALAVVPKICEALQFAHNEGILHRDIKPENILLDSKGRVKIADFGIAKLVGEPHGDATLTAQGATLGTPHYMAPEQVEKPGEVDHRADIYSLGVVFYELLTGELPIGKFQPPSHKVHMDVRLDDVVLHALEKEPARRYQQVREVKTAVDTITSAAPPPAETVRLSTATPATPTQTPDRFWRRFAIAAALFVVSLVVIPMLVILIALILPAYFRGREHAAAVRQQIEAKTAARETQAEAPTGTWSPQIAPGEKTDPQKVLDVARDLTREGSYEEALQRYLWYYDHTRDSDIHASLVGALFAWEELGRKYPKAKQALLKLRDQATLDLGAGRGNGELFQQVAIINSRLKSDDATYALYKSIQEHYPDLAQTCYFYAESLLVQHGDYELCLKYMGDPQQRYSLIVNGLEMERRTIPQIPVRVSRFPATNNGSAAPVPGPLLVMPSDVTEMRKKLATDRFVGQVRQLTEILIGTGHKSDAEKVVAQAVTILDDDRLKSAISDAETRIKSQAKK